MKACIAIVTSLLLLCGSAVAQQQDRDPKLRRPSERGTTTAMIADEVRHQLVTLPWYGVFDWFEAEILPDDTVILRGQVTRPTLKSGAENRVKDIESVAKVVNEIEVLPVSGHDDDIRMAVYRELFNFNSPLFRYALRAVPPIHIIVKGGRVTLKGMVASPMDKHLAVMAARGVPGTFEVKDELVVEKPDSN
jgi:hyperosmotically inducible periplasmic protein